MTSMGTIDGLRCISTGFASRPWLAALLFVATAAAPTAAAQTASLLPRADGGSTPISRYGPQTGCGPAMIVSHGLGGTESGNAGLAAAMARAGWRVVVMGHRESGPAELRSAIRSGNIREGLLQGATDPARHKARFMDLDAAVSDVTGECRPSQFVLVGHSMGALTTMMEAGAVSRFARSGKDRFDAYVAISPQGVGPFYGSGSWSGVRKPVLMITGTQDKTADGPAELRISAFEGLPPGNKRFAMIPGAGHIPLASDRRGPIATAVSGLMTEFLTGISGSRRLPPSNLRGIDISDK
jgi:pimeloyl-ACP methyl ester carboxylesterase